MESISNGANNPVNLASKQPGPRSAIGPPRNNLFASSRVRVIDSSTSTLSLARIAVAAEDNGVDVAVTV
jgi:hypothetical protein